MVAAGFREPNVNLMSDDDAAPPKLEGLKEIMLQQIDQEGVHDPKMAIDYLASEGPAWMKQDPAAAVKWAMDHLQGEAKVLQTAGLFHQVSTENFTPLLQVWQSLPPGVLKARALGELAAAAPADGLSELRPFVTEFMITDRVHLEAGAKHTPQGKSRLEELLK